MAFYADDATFVLNGGRPAVHGAANIRELEAFDAVAGSHVVPIGLKSVEDGGNVVVSLRQVVEHSRIFAAAGLDTVTTEPIDRAFVIRDGKFELVAQPEFNPACRDAVFPAISGAVAWLKKSGDARAETLTKGGKLQLNAQTVAVLAEAIGDWRRTTGWTPNKDQVKLCARRLRDPLD